MPDLKGSKTQQIVKDAFAGESMANRRYLYFATVADVEGYRDIAGNFRDWAEGGAGRAHGQASTEAPISMSRAPLCEAAPVS